LLLVDAIAVNRLSTEYNKLSPSVISVKAEAAVVHSHGFKNPRGFFPASISSLLRREMMLAKIGEDRLVPTNDFCTTAVPLSAKKIPLWRVETSGIAKRCRSASRQKDVTVQTDPFRTSFGTVQISDSDFSGSCSPMYFARSCNVCQLCIGHVYAALTVGRKAARNRLW
jgi:hypothetical protein